MVQTEKTKMVDAMRAVMPGVEKGTSGIEGANLFLFKDNRLFTYNGVTSVSVPFEMGGAKFGVKAVDIFAFVSKLDNLLVNIDLVMDKEDPAKVKSIKVTSGKAKANFALADTSEIEKYLEGIAFEVGKPCPENFAEAFALTTIKNNIHAEMKGVVTTKIGDKTFLAASDKRRISVHELNGEMEEFKVDDDVLADALKLGNPKTYAIVGPWLHLGFDGDVTFSCIRQDLSQFNAPQMLAAMDRLYTIAPAVEGKLPKALPEAIARVSALADVANANTGLTARLTFTPEGITAYTEKSGSGNAEELVPWDADVKFANDGEAVCAWVSINILLEAGNKVTDFKVVCTNTERKSYAFLFTGENYKALVGGITLKDEQK